MKSLPVLAVLLIAVCSCVGEDAPAAEPPATIAERVLRAANVDQGLCLQVGVTDGGLTAALAKKSRLYVQGCTTDQHLVQPSRKKIAAAGVSGRASIVFRESAHLPYADSLANVLVSANWPDESVSPGELLRVMAPGGVAVIGAQNAKAAELLQTEMKKLGVESFQLLSPPGWFSFVKPVDPNLGEWTHLRASADQSYVGDDKLVAPWKEIRWLGDPRWGSLYTSYEGFVTAGGRIYYKENRAAPGGTQGQLVARDAYNGFELWRVNSGAVWSRRYFNVTTLTCDSQHVFLVEDQKLIARDGKTGEQIQEYAIPFAPKTVTSIGDFLLASTRGKCLAVHKKSGETAWSVPAAGHPAAEAGVAYLVDAGVVKAIDIATGKIQWETIVPDLPEKPRASLLVITMTKAGVVYVDFHETWKRVGQVAAFDAKTGRLLWNHNGKFTHNILPFQDGVWAMDRDNKNKVDNMAVLVLDPRTGKEKQRYQANGSVMGKCWGARASAGHILYSNGWYLDRQTGVAEGTVDTRSPCRLGQHPANGLTYFMPHHCDCGVTLRGFLGLSAAGQREWFSPGNEDGEPRLFTTGDKATAIEDVPGDWPMYRRDYQRSNATAEAMPRKLKQAWSASVGSGRLTQATIAYGNVFVAEPESHRVFCRSAASGDPLWSYTADGRVEYPPTLHQGLCLFGTGGGSVVCLEAATGKEIWRLRAAPVQKMIADRNQFESAWPVVGGVLIFDGVAYFSAGHSQSQSSGLWLYGVSPATGEVLWRNRGLGAGDMFVADGTVLSHAHRPYLPKTGERTHSWKPPVGMLRTTTYLGAVAIADYTACVEPALSHKKHIELTDGRIKGEALAFTADLSVAAWRYTPGVPNWKDKDKTNKYFLHAAGAADWNLHDVKQQMLGVAIAGDVAFMAGVPTLQAATDPSQLWVMNGQTGAVLQKHTLAGRPVYDGVSLANGRLYVATANGQLICYEGE